MEATTDTNYRSNLRLADTKKGTASFYVRRLYILYILNSPRTRLTKFILKPSLEDQLLFAYLK